MSLSRLCKEPESPLQQLLYSKGFTMWWEFPASAFPERSGFYPALAQGILMHIWPFYSEYPKLMRAGGAWRTYINRIYEVDSKFGERLGARKFNEADYWGQIAAACRDTCVQIFENKQDIISLVERARVQDLANTDFFSKIASSFSIYLCIHHLSAQGPCTAEFSSQGNGNFALYVNLAFEGDSVMCLMHKDFQWETVDRPHFPNYKKLQKEGGDPVLLDQRERLPVLAPDLNSEVFKSMKDIISLLSDTLLQASPALPSHLKDRQLQLRERWRVLSDMCKSKDLQYKLESVEFQRVLDMHLQSAPAPPRPPHTINTCALYPEQGRLLDFHEHSFHETCLSAELEKFRGSFAETIPCPHNCGTNLPESVLDLRPDIKASFIERKNRTFSYNTLISLQEKCDHCDRIQQTVQLHCGCRLCHYCARYYVQNNGCYKHQVVKEAIDDQVTDFFNEKYPETL